MHKVKCLSKHWITHDCFQIDCEKPEGYAYKVGHSANLSIDLPEFEKFFRPYTFVSINQDQVLSFIIKDYKENKGLSTELAKIQPGDMLKVSDSFGSINYTKPGVFIAAGVGITPFLAILRDLHSRNAHQDHTLLYCSKEHKDVIAENELKMYLGDRAVFLLTREERQGYMHCHIDKELLKEYYGAHEFYICGSGKFVGSMRKALRELKVENITVMDM